MKTKIILSITTILLLILMGSCKKDDFEETEGVCPVVISTIPTNGATNVPLDQVISVTFNEEMNANTINNVTFTVTGSSAISGTIVFQGTTATLTPDSPLTSNTTYTGKVTTGVKDINGNALQTDYIWTFSTSDILSPLVIITDPANLEIDVNINKVITATFNMPMDALTFNATTFKISQGGTDIKGTVSYTGVTASFTPTALLSSNTTYTAVLTKNIKNSDGVNLDSDYVWTFTTGEDMALMVISTDPSNNAIDVGLQKIITATFSEPVNGLTINSSSFTVRQGENVVTGTVTYSASTATFTPVQPLLTGSVYTGTISKSVTTIGGVSLTADYIWSFTTESGSTPIVVATDPKANEMDVVINKTVTATFSEFMNSTTINNTTFTVTQGANKISGTVTYSGTTASFDPVTNLLPGTTYTATITTGAKNGNGISLANDYIWNFTTAAAVPPTIVSTNPANHATGVNPDKTITALFSEPMNQSTINGNTFLLKEGQNIVSGTVTYAGSTASFNPSSNLQESKIYTATITTGAMNLSGIPVANNYVWSFKIADPVVISPPLVVLGDAARFGILAGVGISNNAGFSVINNLDVGISPGVRSSVTGFPPATIVNGAIFASDDVSPPGVAAMLLMAKQSLTSAYLFAEGASTPAPALVSGDLGGTTLAPGIYKSNSTLLIQSGNLTLNANGNANAVWIFQIASGFTTVGGAGGSIILSGGAKASNIFWQVGSSATIGDFTAFHGNILALTSVTMNSGATATGRMLCINGAIVMTDTNTITRP